MGNLDGRDEGVVSEEVDDLAVSETLPKPTISNAVRVAVSALRQGADGAHVVELSRDRSEPLRPEEA